MRKGLNKMKQVLEKIIYFGLTVGIFIVLWRIMGELWDAFVPWNYKTDLLGIFVVTPIIIVVSFILSSLCFKVIRDSK
ncbi:hypothetical protein VQL36_08230 [Chengkuizengella sp. SCS-71B]|uniref:hypothetical protein n=1 Tax=Chengkuizengella sp. SCS-71B TaxID=3115290 RepID=UPI0032C248F9